MRRRRIGLPDLLLAAGSLLVGAACSPNGPGTEASRAAGGARLDTAFVDTMATPDATWTYGPEGHLWFSHLTPYRVHEVDAAGDTLRVVARDYDRPPVTDREREEALAELDWFREQGGELDPERVPDRKPAVRSIHVDRTGHLWVRPYREAGAAGTALDVFGPDGSFLGRLRLPAGIRTSHMVITRDRIYAVHEDELGVERVAILALRRGAGRDGVR